MEYGKYVFQHLYALQMGSLLFSVPINYEKKMREYTKKGVERKFPYCDYYFKGTSPWNFGFASDELELVREENRDGYPFSSKNPPVKLLATLAPVEWGTEPRFDRLCARVPDGRQAIGEARKVELYPFGAAKLRMTEMPKIAGTKTQN